ncbi:MAG TPA: DNA-formamidopyrimidine glycosylase family protein [Aeromicrobium sp.]|nr:DNA-formamidopyrimidine glycosylase family protein [Aeromicrobium sp.]
MPELPEVESLRVFLAERCLGKKVERVELHSLSALKTFDPPLDALVGLPMSAVERRGKFLCAGFGRESSAPPADDLVWLALHLSRSGWVRWREDIRTLKPGPKKGPLAMRARLDDGSGFDVTEAAKEKRLSIHVVTDLMEVPGIAKLGPDPLDERFDVDQLRTALASAGGQIKSALTDQSAIAGVGNAYSDEILHAAKLSPFKNATKLTDDEVDLLHRSLREIMTDALERSAGMPAADLKSEKKSGMKVHGRSGEPCPVCGDTVRSVNYSSSNFQYCPTCQTGGKVLADRRLSKLLK